MEDIDKEDYSVLKYLSQTKRWNVESQRNNEPDMFEKNMNKKAEERLKERGFIDYNKNSRKLWNKDFLLTKKGYDDFHRLKKIKHKDYTLALIIVNIIFFLINGYFILKQLGIIHN